MSSMEDSTSKRPLEKEESDASKTETKVSADQPSGTAGTEEQPAKKPKLEEKPAEAEGKNEAPKEEGKETPKPEKEPAKPEKEAESKPAEKEAEKPPAEAKQAPPAASGTGTSTSRPELSEKDEEGRIRKPTNDDILLGRGKPFQNHPGNQRMLKIVDEHKERYLSEKRDKKRAIVEQVLDIIQKDGARFLKRIDHGEYWREVETTVSFEKVSHALRSKVRRPEGFEVNQNNSSSAPKGPLPILPEGAGPNGAQPMGAASLYNPQLLQQRGMFPDAAMGLGLMPPFGLMPNMFNPNLMRGLQAPPAGAPAGSDLEQLVRSQMVDSLLRQRQQLDEALNDVAGGMRLPPNYK